MFVTGGWQCKQIAEQPDVAQSPVLAYLDGTEYSLHRVGMAQFQAKLVGVLPLGIALNGTLVGANSGIRLLGTLRRIHAFQRGLDMQACFRR